ncbi:MAG: hypothetical protein ACKVS6_05100 [Planctomycetota bacterium]
MVDQIPPPPVAPARKGFPTWVLACCASCLLFILVTGGCVGFMTYSFVRVATEGAVPETQEKIYSEIVKNVGPPSGFRPIQSIDAPWPLSGTKCVFFVPADLQGSEFGTLLQSAQTIVVFIQANENESERAERDAFFDKGELQSSQGFTEFLQPMMGVDAGSMPEIDTGIISGHKIPVRYAIANIEDNTGNEQKSEKQNRRRRGSREASMGFVDLTNPAEKGVAKQMLVFRRDNELITPEYLEELCKNLRPGE